MRPSRRFRAAGPIANSWSPGNALRGWWEPVVFFPILRHSPPTRSMVRLLPESAHAPTRFCPKVGCQTASLMSKEPPPCLQGRGQT